MKADKSSYHHPNLKEALIKRAMALLETTPYEDITVRGLTDALGMSRTAIYRHFPSKEALFWAVVERGFEMLYKKMLPVWQAKDIALPKKFELLGRAYITFALRHPALYRLMMGDTLRYTRSQNCQKASQLEDPAFNILMQLVKETKKDQYKRDSQDTLVSALAIWSMLHGQASLLLDGHPLVLEKKEALFEHLLEMMRATLGLEDHP